MKKGISLIVLVITIIVMIIIAGAIIISLNSSNVTNKASWSSISSDRANLQAEFATILADVISNEKIGAGQDYVGVTIADVQATDNYKTWAKKVEDTNTRFDVSVPNDNTNPAGIKVVMNITTDEANAFGLTHDGSVVKTYDWVKIGPVLTNDSAASYR